MKAIISRFSKSLDFSLYNCTIVLVTDGADGADAAAAIRSN